MRVSFSYSFFIMPSLSIITLCTMFLIELLWVTISMVVPYFLFISSSRISISREVFESRAPVGSSQSSSLGFFISALAMAQRCC